jgi:hypothetical protein
VAYKKGETYQHSVCYSGGRVGVGTLQKGMLKEMCLCILRKKIVLFALTLHSIDGVVRENLK